jgi:hypothetical protein
MIPLVAAVVLASSAGAPSAVLPSGTYSYEIYSEGKPVAKSTIVIHNVNGSLQITEATTIQDDPVATTRTIDPATFSTLQYVMTSEGSQDTIDIPANAAIWRKAAGDKTLSQVVAGPSIVFDFFAGPYAAIPAMLHATSAKAFNVYCICFTGFDVKPGTIAPATAAPPAGVPPKDVSAAFEFDDAVVTLWYDPVTFVLYAIDAPKAQFRIVQQP